MESCDRRRKMAAVGARKQMKLTGRKFKQLRRIMMLKTNQGSDFSTKIDSQPSAESERLDFVLRRVKAADHGETSSSSNHSTQEEVNPKEEKPISETVHDMDKSVLEKESELFDACVCKPTKPDFVEYWVPVGLSEMQTELYCGTLFSNADLLCSYQNQNHGSMEFLNEVFVSILISTKKCCDHPYLLDPDLSTFLIRDIPKPELLNAEIKLSNKLLLLHKILLEIRKRGLRVLILYQSLGGSSSFSIGDILEEIIDQEFGTDLSVRIGGNGTVSRKQKLASLKTFNDKNNGKFICLMETRSCIPSVKLTSMDAVIFFNSDCNPTNDLKALQKIELDSQFKQVKVFRLYSSDTLEEKALILAKEGMALEGRIFDIKQSTCHQLLSWGAPHLFEKLDEFHDGNSSIASVENSLEDVFLELASLLPGNEKSGSVLETKTSLIAEVKQIDGVYSSNTSVGKDLLIDSDISLSGKMILKEPRVFWMKILEGRNPNWKYFSMLPRRVKRSVKQAYNLIEAEPASKKRRKDSRSSLYQFPSNIRRKIRSKLRKRSKGKKFSVSGGENCNLVSNNVKHDCLPSSRTTQNNQYHGIHSPEMHQPNVHIASPSDFVGARVSLISQNPEPSETRHIALKPSCKALQIELEGLEKQRSELLKMHEEKKLQTMMACEKEIDEIRKKYDILLQNAETALLEEKEVIEAKHSKLLINKTLAEALLHKYNTKAASSNAVTGPNQVGEIRAVSLCSRSERYKVRCPAPHFWGTRSPQLALTPKLSPPDRAVFQPVPLQRLNSWAPLSLGLPL